MRLANMNRISEETMAWDYCAGKNRKLLVSFYYFSKKTIKKLPETSRKTNFPRPILHNYIRNKNRRGERLPLKA